MFVITGFCSAQNGYDICLETFASTKTINTVSYTMTKKERVDGKMIEQCSSTKLRVNPLQVYIRQKAPNDGLEVLYKKGTNENKALINPNGFPWMNISMNPMSSTMRKNQHHTLFDSGFGLFISILEYLFEKYGDETPSMVSIEKSAVWDGNDCWVINFKNKFYKIIDYKVKKGETILDIANKFKLSEFSILEMNDDVDDYEDVKEGQVIKIPNDYSPAMTLYIDKVRKIPLTIEVKDLDGLYEKYEYTDVKLNPSFSLEDFSKDNKSYGF